MAEDERRLRVDIAVARRAAGLSQETVGSAGGISASPESRIERGATRQVDPMVLAAIGAVVGLDVRLRAFPAGDAIRDAGKNRLLERMRVHPMLGWRTEVPLPIEGDLRAWDAVIRDPGWRLLIEAETVLADIQATERRLALKQRDGGEDHVLLLLADTATNRRALTAAPGAFAASLLRTREILTGLGRGDDPGAGGIVIL